MRCGRTYIDPEHKLAQPVGPGEHQARLVEHLLQRLWQTAKKIFSPSQTPRVPGAGPAPTCLGLGLTEQGWPRWPHNIRETSYAIR